MNTVTSYLRQAGVAIRFLVLATLVLGVGYPLVIWGAGNLVSPAHANGSVESIAEQPAASTLIAQNPQNAPNPGGAGAGGAEWFFPRPSAVKWDPASSSPSNLGPKDPALAENIASARAEVAAREGVNASAVPMDAVTSSGSGLDPQISLAYADLQAPRVARESGVPAETVSELIRKSTTSGLESLLGQESVNVTQLNLALANAKAK